MCALIGDIYSVKSFVCYAVSHRNDECCEASQQLREWRGAMKLTKRIRSGSAGNGNGQRDPSLQELDLLARYKRRPTVKVRNQLIEHYRPLVESLARSLVARLPRSVDVQDMIHAGVWGLMQSIEKFELERGTQFTSFMVVRARGAMIDELRNIDYLPRLYRHRHRMLEGAQEKLRVSLDREPSDGELAEELGVTESRLRRSYVALPPLCGGAGERRSMADDVRDRDGMDGLADDGLESPLEAIDRQDMIEMIEASLQPIEWKVLRMHYLEGMSGKDVARKLRLSASRICQIHGKVLSRLKSRLND